VGTNPVMEAILNTTSAPVAPASIYDFPELFRAVQIEAKGEIEAETEFLKQIFARHLPRPVRRVLDIACGDSPHGQVLAREGIEVLAIDRNPRMLDSGRHKAESLPGIRFYQRQIERFSLPAGNCDAAYFLSETFPVMLDNADILSHLRSVARALRKGGLYCIDIDRHDGIEAVGRRRRLWRTRQVRRGAVKLDVREFYRPLPWHIGAWIYELECRIHFPGRRPVLTRDLIPVRYTLPSQLEFAARASGVFRMIACYTDLSLTTPIEQCDRRWMGVLRRL